MILSFLKKIDFLKIFCVITIISIFYMYASAYYYECFPNCYAWKEMMIKWCDGEIIRRGLLGTIFYALEPTISIKYSATILNFVCIIFCFCSIYNSLKKLNLPKWLLFAIVMSPALILFNLHSNLVLKKDIIAITGCLITMNYIRYYWENKLNDGEINLKTAAIFVLTYTYIFTLFLLCYEVFVVFIPLTLLFTFHIIAKKNYFKFALKITTILALISFIVFVTLTIPYAGDESIAIRIAKDWAQLYPKLFIFANALTDVKGPPDPLAFLMMEPTQYKNYYIYISSITKYYELLIIYVLMVLPLFFIIKASMLKIDVSERVKTIINNKKKILVFTILLVTHFPLLLSLVAFDYGRWLVFTNYGMIIFICYFTKSRDRQIFKSKVLTCICWLLSIVYVVCWKPHHWAPMLIQFFDLSLFESLLNYYSNFYDVYDLLFRQV